MPMCAKFISVRFHSHVTIVSLVVSGICCQCRCHFYWSVNRIGEIGLSEKCRQFRLIFSGDLITWEYRWIMANRIFIILSSENLAAQFNCVRWLFIFTFRCMDFLITVVLEKRCLLLIGAPHHSHTFIVIATGKRYDTDRIYWKQ